MRPYVNGYSPQKLSANVNHIIRFKNALTKLVENRKSPIKRSEVKGIFDLIQFNETTDANLPRILSIYLDNHAHGYGGDGTPLVGTPEFPILQKEGYTPKKLTKEELAIVNAMTGQKSRALTAEEGAQLNESRLSEYTKEKEEFERINLGEKSTKKKPSKIKAGEKSQALAKLSEAQGSYAKEKSEGYSNPLYIEIEKLIKKHKRFFENEGKPFFKEINLIERLEPTIESLRMDLIQNIPLSGFSIRANPLAETARRSGIVPRYDLAAIGFSPENSGPRQKTGQPIGLNRFNWNSRVETRPFTGLSYINNLRNKNEQ